MFLKVTKNSAGQCYHQIVESYRNEEGKVRQRVLLSLGRVEDGKAELLLENLSRQKKKFEAIDLAKDISVDKTYILGPLLLVAAVFGKVGINLVLDEIQAKHPKLEIDFKKTVFTMAVARFVKPCSKLKIFEHWQKIFFSKMLTEDLPLHHFYRVLDILASHKEEIEKALYWQDRDLLNQRSDVVLYDLTTLRFESTSETEKLRRFGYSKEMRSDCTQVVFGLLIDTEGIPLGFEVYPGNTFEGQTLEGMVEKIRTRFQVRRLIFVADRGLFSSENLSHLRKDKGEFIVGHRLGSLKKDLKEQHYDLTKFTWIIEDELAILETKTEAGDRLIISWSKSRSDRDAKTRNDILEKIKKKLSVNKPTAKKFVSNKNYQKFLKGLDQGAPVLNEVAIAEAGKKDGFFGVVTNVNSMTAREIILNYKELWKIEDAFGEIKGTLKARPVFHWTDKRILGHLTACFLSYYCEATVTKCLREKKVFLKSSHTDVDTLKPRGLTVVEALKDLVEVRAIPVRVRDQLVWVRTDIAGNAASILQAIGCRIPPKVLHIEDLKTEL